jgi:hypothetical protein
MGERKTLGEWITPLYGQQISSQSVGRYQEILSKDNIDLIDASCSATYEKLLQIGQVNERS